MRFLEQFATDLHRQPARDPVIGREAELAALIRVLCRKHKNNPALVGPPGVGKTAVVEELARRMNRGQVPVQLRSKRLFALNMAALVAGTKYRGEFEERVNDLLSEIRQAGNILLFIDEMHTLIGAGSAEGAIDAANILKPALSRGGVQLIGATTDREYHRHIEADPALARRFCVIRVAPTDREQTLAVLRGLVPGLETHHRVRILPDALLAAVDLGERCLSGAAFPDKAIDLLDETAAAVSLGDGVCVDRQAVARTVERRTGIPARRLEQTDRAALLDLERRLGQSVLGQEEAVRQAAAAVRRGRAGLADRTRPVAALLFCGPTGVGKTALCKALAREVYGSEAAMIRLDMSEYREMHTVSRLLGAPPGYVGHGEGGELTEKVRARPWSLVLFDELEKAHRDVTHLLLQILDEGTLTDAEGVTADFRHTLIVMTTNAGQTGAKAAAGFAAADPGDRRLRDDFSPELLGRMDAIVRFRPLSAPVLEQIARQKLGQTLRRAEAAGLRVRLRGDCAAVLAARCLQEGSGARALRHALQTAVETPLADCLLSGQTSAELVAGPATLTVTAPTGLRV